MEIRLCLTNIKKDKRADPANYQPVSLTSILCITFEHILVSQIMKHLEDHQILCPNQFGFRAKHSCESQLLLTVTVHYFSCFMNNRTQVDVGILDFSKAFDKVGHLRLAQKLEFYGIRGKALQWIKSFLSNRSQQVVVEGSYSTPCKVTSGIPQGSVLAPTLFLIYINDLVTDIQSTVCLFADDCLIYCPILTPTDHQILQEDLQKLSIWADKWKMKFNISKCCYQISAIKVTLYTQCQVKLSRFLSSTLTWGLLLTTSCHGNPMLTLCVAKP